MKTVLPIALSLTLLGLILIALAVSFTMPQTVVYYEGYVQERHNQTSVGIISNSAVELTTCGPAIPEPGKRIAVAFRDNGDVKRAYVCHNNAESTQIEAAI